MYFIHNMILVRCRAVVTGELVLDLVHHTLLLMLVMLHRNSRASGVSCRGGLRGGYGGVLVLVLVLTTSQLLLYLCCQPLLPSPTLPIILRLHQTNKQIISHFKTTIIFFKEKL